MPRIPRTRPTLQAIRVVAATALGSGDILVEPVETGVSTFVYRLTRGGETFYLRVLPEVGASFAPEAAAHEMLCRQGVRVPEVLYWEELNPEVERSVMVTTEIKGLPLAHIRVGRELPEILRAAGRDLALLNLVPVEDFGWVDRGDPSRGDLAADLPSEREFMLADLDLSLNSLEGGTLPPGQTDTIRAIITAQSSLFDAAHGSLAHGDFDLTHIYHQDGHYTGIIDLGEIRGTGPYYDLGHFRFHDGEAQPETTLPYLQAGYQEVTPLPPDADRRIALASLLIGTRFLARTQSRLTRHSRRHAVAAIARDSAFLAV